MKKTNIQIIKEFFKSCKGKSFTLPDKQIVRFNDLNLKVELSKFYKSSKSLAKCHIERKLLLGSPNEYTISFSEQIVNECDSKDSLIDTCIHELGHAIASERGNHNHDRFWKQTTKELYKVILGLNKSCKRCASSLENPWLIEKAFAYFADKFGNKITAIKQLSQEILDGVQNGTTFFDGIKGAYQGEVKIVDSNCKVLFEYCKIENPKFRLVEENFKSEKRRVLKTFKNEEEALEHYSSVFENHVVDYVKQLMNNQSLKEKGMTIEDVFEDYKKDFKNKIILIEKTNEQKENECIEYFIPVKTCVKKHIIEALTDLNIQ